MFEAVKKRHGRDYTHHGHKLRFLWKFVFFESLVGTSHAKCCFGYHGKTLLIAVSFSDIISLVDSKHHKTLEAIFQKPERANILWRDVESLFAVLGAEISEGNGSRVRVALKGVRAVFHRPHPRKETNKGAVKSVRRFLEAAGVKP